MNHFGVAGGTSFTFAADISADSCVSRSEAGGGAAGTSLQIELPQNETVTFWPEGVPGTNRSSYAEFRPDSADRVEIPGMRVERSRDSASGKCFYTVTFLADGGSSTAPTLFVNTGRESASVAYYRRHPAAVPARAQPAAPASDRPVAPIPPTPPDNPSPPPPAPPTPPLSPQPAEPVPGAAPLTAQVPPPAAHLSARTIASPGVSARPPVESPAPIRVVPVAPPPAPKPPSVAPAPAAVTVAPVSPLAAAPVAPQPTLRSPAAVPPLLAPAAVPQPSAAAAVTTRATPSIVVPSPVTAPPPVYLEPIGGGPVTPSWRPAPSVPGATETEIIDARVIADLSELHHRLAAAPDEHRIRVDGHHCMVATLTQRDQITIRVSDIPDAGPSGAAGAHKFDRMTFTVSGGRWRMVWSNEGAAGPEPRRADESQTAVRGGEVVSRRLAMLGSQTFSIPRTALQDSDRAPAMRDVAVATLPGGPGGTGNTWNEVAGLLESLRNRTRSGGDLQVGALYRGQTRPSALATRGPSTLSCHAVPAASWSNDPDWLRRSFPLTALNAFDSDAGATKGGGGLDDLRLRAAALVPRPSTLSCHAAPSNSWANDPDWLRRSFPLREFALPNPDAGAAKAGGTVGSFLPAPAGTPGASPEQLSCVVRPVTPTVMVAGLRDGTGRSPLWATAWVIGSFHPDGGSNPMRYAVLSNGRELEGAELEAFCSRNQDYARAMAAGLYTTAQPGTLP